ncbi:hypothetical protein BHE74_00042193 [Ensete ventricosum]|nr:hypothetical protein GW17_00049477 [Ensete ventricosum]RWW51461.1 hypothetical protein BHE74_00042193 [Ensete ventricosum]
MLNGCDQHLTGPDLQFFISGPKRQDSLVLVSNQSARIMDLIDKGAREVKPLQGKGSKAPKKKRERKKRTTTYPDGRLGGPVHKLLKGAIIQLLRQSGVKSPPQILPGQRTLGPHRVYPEIDDHLGVSGSSPSSIFNHVTIEAKYSSAPARSSTLHISNGVSPLRDFLDLHKLLPLTNQLPSLLGRSLCGAPESVAREPPSYCVSSYSSLRWCWGASQSWR